MAKRESIWRAADGTEHRSKQSAAVADAEHEVREAVKAFGVMRSIDVNEGERPTVDGNAIIRCVDVFADAICGLVKARAALAKHEEKAR